MNAGRFLFMLVDATGTGRRTNWKYVILLIFIAAAAIFGSWLLEHPVTLWVPWTIHVPEGDWIEAPCTPWMEAEAVRGGVILSGDDRLTVLDGQGTAVCSEEFAGGTVTGAGKLALSYVPLDSLVYLWDGQRHVQISLHGCVDAAFAGESYGAVITAGSGYLTKTVIFNSDGTVTGEVGLVRGAMTAVAFLPEDTGLVALSFSVDGKWYLSVYGLDGIEHSSTELPAVWCSTVWTVEARIFVRTDQEILIYDSVLKPCGSVSFGTGQFVAATAGDRGFFALITESRGRYCLSICSSDGTRLGQTELPMEPLDICISGRGIYVLDREALRIYDSACSSRYICDEGARAWGLKAGDGDLWLLGDGEILKF